MQDKLRVAPDFDGPVQARKCTDIIFTLAIILLWITMTGVGISSVSEVRGGVPTNCHDLQLSSVPSTVTTPVSLVREWASRYNLLVWCGVRRYEVVAHVHAARPVGCCPTPLLSFLSRFRSPSQGDVGKLLAPTDYEGINLVPCCCVTGYKSRL